MIIDVSLAEDRLVEVANVCRWGLSNFFSSKKFHGREERHRLYEAEVWRHRGEPPAAARPWLERLARSGTAVLSGAAVFDASERELLVEHEGRARRIGLGASSSRPTRASSCSPSPVGRCRAWRGWAARRPC